MQSIRPDNIETHVRFLSLDLLEGRGTGQRGGDLAAEYIATQFSLYGLKPAGDKGTYMQKVPFVGITPGPDTRFSFVPAKGNATDLKPLDEYVAYDQTQQASSEIDAEIVFVGYGIEAPEYNWDDYKGLDVKGKVLLMLVNQPTDDPKLFHGKAMTYYGRWTYKYEEAARRGAAGVLIVHETGPAGYPWEVVQNSNTGPREELPPGDAYHPLTQGWLSHEAAGKLFAAAGLSLDALARAAARRGFKPVALKPTASLTLHHAARSIVSHNVAALVKGSRHPEQVVVYSAHWDHFGTRPGPDGNPQIFHGAIDNASGIAGLLELATVYAAARPAPARSVLFIATTEIGRASCRERGE